LIGPFLKTADRRYVVVVHDADPHPGDITGLAHGWLLHDAAKADHVIALSKSVATALSRKPRIRSDRIVTLFHPMMAYSKARSKAVWAGERPLRLLFFGRIMAYKGLDLFVESLELLRARGVSIEATVAGEGSLNGQSKRLARLGVAVINRWLRDTEISELLETHDSVVLTHIEASQSGCAAAALGAGLPVIATPVGGLADQIVHEVNGLVADRVDATAIAQQLARLASEPALYRGLAAGATRAQHSRDMRGFLDSMLSAISWNAN